MNTTNNKGKILTPPSGDGGMEYDFRDIEKKWQQKWKESEVYKVENDFSKPKCYILDMFPYPSGAGLHVGHPLGYIASDIYSRYKRLKGFNVLHPMGFDSFGLPAEQYALDTGQHPADTTKKNIETFKAQLNNIGFSYDWDREVQTSDPNFYKWTQWVFLQLFNSYYDRKDQKAKPIAELIKHFENKGSADCQLPTANSFTATEWKQYDEKTQQDILMQCRLAFCGYGEVNWCEALGTVLANDEVINGVSERGGHPVVKKKLRQWYLRITEYADRLLEGLEKVEFSDAMKEMQTNWIGKSSGAEMEFEIRGSASPQPSPGGEEDASPQPSPDGEGESSRFFQTVDKSYWGILKKYGRENRKNPTEAEKILWQRMRNNQLGVKVRRQHAIHGYIADFAMLEVKLIVEADGEYHSKEDQQIYDEVRTKFLKQYGIDVLRFTNQEIIQSTDIVIKKIADEIKSRKDKRNQNTETELPLLREEKGSGDEATLRVYTTRPDTIFGVDFMVIAPEHELVDKIKSKEQEKSVDEYITYVKSRSERERMAEKKITGVFTGAYSLNPFNGREIPIWISEYVLIGYGTGAIMAVPCGDQRDFLFAKHFNIPITNIIGKHFNGEEADPTKDAVLENSEFINGMVMKDAIDVVIKKLEELGIGERKVNYKMRDASFSRQRYWGEPFPIVWKDGIAYPLDEKELPLVLPEVKNYKPGPDGEGPLANISEWALIPNPSPQAEKGAARVPKYAVHTPKQYELAKEMRKGHTEAEGILWEQLRDSKLGVKFRRQHPIDTYIVDFVCLQERLIVEVDGGYHNTEDQKKYDDQRTKTLNEIGFDVIRFTNEEVTKHPYKIKDKIKTELGRRIPSPLVERGQGVRETNTMPGYAGSSWYFLRYMDPQNDKTFCDRNISDYWNQVDIYIGGTEHAVGHLLYSRMWTKVLYDLNMIGFDEPYKRLVNQGMIQGVSEIIKELRVGRDFSGTYSGFAKRVQFHVDDISVSLNVSENINSHIYISKEVDFDFKLSVLEKNGNLIQVEKEISEHHAKIAFINQGSEKSVLDIEKWMSIESVYEGSILICYNGYWQNNGFYNFNGEPSSAKLEFLTRPVVEKMSKSKLNTVNPDELCEKYGADTFRMYEMFLGPVEMSKPWDTKGIEGVHRFLKKFWRLFFDDSSPSPSGEGRGEANLLTNEDPTPAELKILHTAIKKIESDTERFSFNTAVSAFMIATNELTDLKCHKRKILEPLVILLAPYAPHIAEELYAQLRNSLSPQGEGRGETSPSPLLVERVGGEVSSHWRGVGSEAYPTFEEKYIKETTKTYPIAINGKTRTELTISLDATQQQVEEIVLKNEAVLKWLEGKSPKKFIYVKNKMINIVV